MLFRRAFADSWSFARHHFPSVIFTLLGTYAALPIASQLGLVDLEQEGLIQLFEGLIGPLALVAGAYVVFLIRAAFIRYFGDLRYWRARLFLWWFGIAAGVVIATGFSIVLVLDWRRGAIIWDYGPGSPLATSMSRGDARGDSFWINGFQIKGNNRSDAPIIPISAFVRSDVNGRQIALSLNFNGSPLPLAEGVIGARSDFSLIGTLPPTDSRYSGGISEAEFREQFGEFTFVFSWPGHEYRRPFLRTEVDAILARDAKQNTDALDASAKLFPHGGVSRRPQ